MRLLSHREELAHLSWAGIASPPIREHRSDTCCWLPRSAPLECWFKTPKWLQGLSAPEATKGIWSHPPWPWTFYHAPLLLLFVTFPITALKCPARTSLSFWTPSSLKSSSKASLSWGMLSDSDTPSTAVQCRTAGYTKFTCGSLPDAQRWHLSITGLSLYFSPWRPVAATFHASQEWRCP